MIVWNIDLYLEIKEDNHTVIYRLIEYFSLSSNANFVTELIL